jgi:TP901 family phage tail tape measure protein
MAIRAADLEVRVTADTSQAQGELNNFQGMLAGVLVGGKIQNLGEGMLDFVTDFVSVGATFEEQMTVVDQIIGGTISHIDELKQAAIDADIETMFNAQEVAEGMEMIARAGFSAQQIIGTPGKSDGLINSVLYFAAATKTNVAEAGQTFSAAARIFEGSGLGMIEISDLLTAAILRSGKSSADFMTAFQYVGTISQQWGTAPDEIATAIALLSQLGIRSRSVGTGLRSMYSAFGAKGDEIASLGIDLYDVDAAGNQVLKTLPDIIGQFNQYLSTLDMAGKSKVMEDLFGKPASSPLLTLFTTGADNWDRIVEDMDNVGSAQEMMEARMNTLRGSLEILSATWLGFKKVLGDSVSDYIKPVVDALAQFVNWLQNLPEAALKVIAIVTAFTAVLLTLTGAIIVFTALLGPVGGVAGVLAVVGATALPLIAIFAGIGLGIAALKTNFGGVTDFFTGLSDKWDEFKERYEEGMDGEDIHNNEMGDGPLGKADPNRAKGFYNVAINALAAIRDMGGPDGLGMFKTLWPHLMEAADGFGIIGRSVSRLSNVIKKHGLAEGMRQLFMGDIGKDILKGFGDILSEAPRLFGTFLRNFDTGSKDVNRLFKNLGSAFQLFGSFIEDVFDGKFEEAREDLQRMFRRLGLAAFDVGIITLRIAGWVFEQAVDVYEGLKNWIMSAITGEETHVNEAGDGPLGTTSQKKGFPIGTVLLTIADWAFNGAVSLTQRFQTWLNEKMRETFGADPTTADLIGHGTGENANVITIDGIKIHLSPGEITWEESVDWGQLALRLLGDADNKLSKALGIDRSEKDLDNSYDAGHKAGENAAESVFHGIRDGINWYVDNAEFNKGDGGTSAQGEGDGGGPDVWKIVKKIWNFELMPKSDPTFIDSAMKWAQGAGGGIHDAIAEGLNSSIYGDTSRINELGDGPLGTPPENTQGLAANWWDRFVENIWGTPSSFVVNLAETINGYISSASEFLNSTLPGWFAGLFDDIDFSGTFDGVGDGIAGSWNSMINGLTDMLDVPDWAIKLANGDYLGAVKSLFGGGGDGEGGKGAKPDTYPGAADLSEEYKKIFEKIKRGPEAVPVAAPEALPEVTPEITPVATPVSFLPQTTAASGAMATAATALLQTADDGTRNVQNFSKDVSAALTDIARDFLTFGTAIPLALTPFQTGVKTSATNAMSSFNAALGAGFATAITIAAFGARATAIAAQMPSMYGHGYSVGLSLGQGMAAGIRAAIGDVIAARNALRYAGTGESDRSQPFSAPAPSSSGQIPAKTPQLIYQTNNVNIDPKHVGEFFETAGFVSNLDRDRQIVLGRA